MKVKRYDMRQSFDGRMVMLDVRDGVFVRHDDYASLLAERENLNQQVVNLAVENAALKCAFTITDETDTDDAENEFHDVAVIVMATWNACRAAMLKSVTNEP